jgi:hypothetical protein
MAIYSANMSYFSRAKGRIDEQGINWSRDRKKKAFSAVASAAYRAGAKLTDHRTGEVYDYSRKVGVFTSFVMGPGGSGSWSREQLWNKAEESESRYNSRVAREWMVALPHELTHAQRLALVRDIAGRLVERYGVAVDASIHLPTTEGDQRNPPAHIMFTTRRIDADGSFGEKTYELDAWGPSGGSAEVKAFRGIISDCTNAALAAAGSSERVTHMSNKELGVDLKPSVHVGVNATNAKRRGKPEPKSGLAMVKDQQHRYTMDWNDFDRGKSRHQHNLEIGAAAAYTAQHRIDMMKAEQAKAEKYLGELLEAKRLAGLHRAPTRGIKLPKAGRGATSEQKVMMVFSGLLAELLAALIQGFGSMGVQLAVAAISGIERDVDRDQQIKAVRGHRKLLAAKLVKWEGILKAEQYKFGDVTAEEYRARRARTSRKEPGEPFGSVVLSPGELAALKKRRRPQKMKRPYAAGMGAKPQQRQPGNNAAKPNGPAGRGADDKPLT